MGFIQRNKTPFIASSTTVYYNNSSWQVLSEYDGSNNFQRSFIYGNYIDEVLMMTDSGSNDYYYAHDHLFSPAATKTKRTIAQTAGTMKKL